MNQPSLKSKRTLRFGKIITILSILSLVLTVIGQFRYYILPLLDIGNVYRYVFHFPEIGILIISVINIVPSVLFFIYILTFYKKNKTAIIVPIIFGVLATTPLLWHIYNYIDYGIFPRFDMYFLLDLLCAITFVLAIIDALQGFNEKVFTIIAIVVGLIPSIRDFISYFKDISWYIETIEQGYILFIPAILLGSIALYIALLLFCLGNRIPHLIPISAEKLKKKLEKKTPEQGLKYLRENFELGLITEEEYQVQRGDIISKL